MRKLNFCTCSIVAVLLTISFGCNKEIPPRNTDEIIISKDAVVIDTKTWKENFISMDSTNFTLTFTDKSEIIKKIKPGNLIVSETGSGLLRRISSIRTLSGQIIMITSPAVLTDLIEQGDVEYTKLLSPTSMESIEIEKNGSLEMIKSPAPFGGEASYSWSFNKPFDSGASINGTFNFSWDIVTRIKIKFLKTLKEAHFGFNANQSSSIHAEVSGLLNKTEEDTLATINFNSFTIYIAGVPVVFKPRVLLKVGAKFNTTGSVQCAFNQTHTFKTGIQYNNETGWDKYQENTKSMTMTLPVPLTTIATIEGYLHPTLEVLIYGAAGPYCGLKLKGIAEITPSINPVWKLKRGMEVLLGVKLNVLSWSFEKEWSVLDYVEQVAQAESIPPEITISNIRNLNPSNAFCDWEIAKTGTLAVISRGICWNTSANPNINNSRTTEDGTIGQFSSQMNNMTQNTTYYVKAYCKTSDNNIHYSANQLTFKTPTDPITDQRDNNVYNTVGIGSQIWMAKNLAYLPSVNSKLETSPSEPRYYVYDYNGSVVKNAKSTLNYAKYGVLYNHKAALTACPTGWRLPTQNDFMVLSSFLGGNNDQGMKLKSTYDWKSTDGGVQGTDNYGFNALPAGGVYSQGYFNMYNLTFFWTSAFLQNMPFVATLHYNSHGLGIGNSSNLIAGSIRCIKN